MGAALIGGLLPPSVRWTEAREPAQAADEPPPALAEEVPGLGIDAKVNRPLSQGVMESVTSPAKRTMLADLARRAPIGLPWDTLLFSAKEAVYRTWFPLTRRRPGFDEAEVVLDPGGPGP